jgi:hypothetical protein
MSPSLDVVDSVLAVNVAIYKSAEEGGGFRKYFAQMEKKTKKNARPLKNGRTREKTPVWATFCGDRG